MKAAFYAAACVAGFVFVLGADILFDKWLTDTFGFLFFVWFWIGFLAIAIWYGFYKVFRSEGARKGSK